MPTITYTLHYADAEFRITHTDYEMLKGLYDRAEGRPSLWRFTPADSDEEVAVAIGGGATFYVTRNIDAD
ncbi:hypothetical protein ACTJJ4_07480 [Microbacterium sp. 22195]|uniref:hypothetical protein n=1 Tax=Microbacterium sp. 22195 TaxID=3453891 RepID=UPI003F839372